MSKSGDALRTVRKQVGLTRKELGMLAGVSPEAVYLIESGRRPNPGIETMKALMGAMGYRIRYEQGTD